MFDNVILIDVIILIYVNDNHFSLIWYVFYCWIILKLLFFSSNIIIIYKGDKIKLKIFVLVAKKPLF
jgi:hypothetical protein